MSTIFTPVNPANPTTFPENNKNTNDDSDSVLSDEEPLSEVPSDGNEEVSSAQIEVSSSDMTKAGDFSGRAEQTTSNTSHKRKRSTEDLNRPVSKVQRSEDNYR